jgi:hypothetical protein
MDVVWTHKEVAMRIVPCVLAVVLAATAAGCAEPYHGNGTRYDEPEYSNQTAASPYGYSSKWDYYRNYGGTISD